MGVGVRFENCIEGDQQLGQAFIASEAADKADDWRVRMNSVLEADLGVPGREMIGVDSTAAAGAQDCQFFRRAYTEVFHFAAQADAVADDSVGAGGSETLGLQQQPALEAMRALQAQAAEQVDAPRNAREPCGNHAEQAGLRGTEFDQVGGVMNQYFPDAEAGPDVLQWSYAAFHGDGN